ncbi:hypothetical protein GN316_03095 [Xylophilus sp. Kf1]|nr:hypothetical protein [Xylophilus sp. Kf1]
MKRNVSDKAYYNCDHCGFAGQHKWQKTSDAYMASIAPTPAPAPAASAATPAASTPAAPTPPAPPKPRNSSLFGGTFLG